MLNRKRLIEAKNVFLKDYPNEAAKIKITRRMEDNINGFIYFLSFVNEYCIMYYNFKTAESFKF